MKKFIFHFAMVNVSLLAAFAQSPAPSSSMLERTLAANSSAFAQALLHNDVAFLRRTLTGDFEQINSAGRVEGDEEIFEAAQNGEFHEYSQYNVRVLPITEDSAVVTYDCIVSRPEGDAGVAPRYQHISELWLHDDGAWRLRFLQATPNRPVD